MGLKYAERVRETTSNKPATSATAFELAGAKTGFRSFVAGIGSTHQCIYTAEKVDANGNPAGAWEVAVGTVTDAAPDTLSRAHLIDSSTPGAFIDWSATGENSSPEVFVSFPAGMGEGLFQPVIYPGTNVWWRPVTAPGTLVGAAIGVNRVHIQPFFIPRPMILKGLRAHCTAGAGAGRNVRLGFYRARGQANQVMDRVAYSVEQDCSTTGEKKDETISQFLQPGLYFSALLSNSNLPSFAGTGAAAAMNPLSAMLLGVNDTAMTSSTGVAGYYDNGPAYGIPPATITPDGQPSTDQPVVEAKLELAA